MINWLEFKSRYNDQLYRQSKVFDQSSNFLNFNLIFKKKDTLQILDIFQSETCLCINARSNDISVNIFSHLPCSHQAHNMHILFYKPCIVCFRNKNFQRTSKCLISSMRTSLGYQQLLLMGCGMNIVDIYASTKAFIWRFIFQAIIMTLSESLLI